MVVWIMCLKMSVFENSEVILHAQELLYKNDAIIIHLVETIKSVQPE